MLRRITEAFGAWRRGERRIAPQGVRGRVYEKKDPAAESSAQSEKKISAGPKAVLEMKVTRANGEVETIRVPAKAELVE